MLNAGRIRHVFFDLDHTLWDFEKNSALTFEVLFTRHKLDLSLAQFLEVYVPLNREYWKRYRQGEFTAEELRYARLEAVLTRLQFPFTPQLIHDLAEGYIEQLSSFPHLMEGALELLEYLRPRFPLHILTNGFTKIQERKIRNTGLEEFFNQVIDAETVGVKKPHPEIFEYAENKVNAREDELLMIGDDLEADILGARNRGWQTIHLTEANVETHGKGPQIKGLHEIKRLL